MDVIAICLWMCLNAALTLADCPPPAVQNAALTPNQTSYADGATVTFTCKDGYELAGQRKQTCNESRWEGNSPTCDIKRCPDFGIIDHSIQSDYGIGHYYGSNISSCEDNFVLDGPSSVACQANGTWGQIPTCQPLDCDSVNDMNSSCVDNFLLNNTLYYIQCNKTNVPNTTIGGANESMSYKCETSKKLMYSVFGCFCGCKVWYNESTVKPENLTHVNLPHDSILRWSCREGCTEDSNNTLECNDGKMKMPMCKCIDTTESSITTLLTVTTEGTFEHTPESHTTKVLTVTTIGKFEHTPERHTTEESTVSTKGTFKQTSVEYASKSQSPKESIPSSVNAFGRRAEKQGLQMQAVWGIVAVTLIGVLIILPGVILLYYKRKLCFKSGVES